MSAVGVLEAQALDLPFIFSGCKSSCRANKKISLGGIYPSDLKEEKEQKSMTLKSKYNKRISSFLFSLIPPPSLFITS